MPGLLQRLRGGTCAIRGIECSESNGRTIRLETSPLDHFARTALLNRVHGRAAAALWPDVCVYAFVGSVGRTNDDVSLDPCTGAAEGLKLASANSRVSRCGRLGRRTKLSESSIICHFSE
jgi:hypothetical protein